jgi:hypothetical protein
MTTTVLTKYNPNKPGNFWELNPEFLTIPIYKKFKATDHSKNCEKTSKYMWAIAHYVETENNRLAKLPDEEKKQLIEDEVIANVTWKFKWGDYTEIIEHWLNENKTALERHLDALYNFLDKRTELINNESEQLTMDKLKSVDEAVTRTTAIEERIAALKDRIANDKYEGSVKGGRTESLSERGDI